MTSRTRVRSITPLLVVADLQRSMDFYTRVLGFQDPTSYGEPPCFGMLNRDGLDLMLSVAAEPAHVRPNGPTGAWDLYICVVDLDVELAAFAEHGLRLERGPSETFYKMREIDVLDPDGHRICVAQDVSGGIPRGAEAWEGVLDIGSAKLRLVLNLVDTGKELLGALDSPDQNAMHLPVDRVVRDASTLRFEMNALAATFEGTLDASRSEAVGQWSQRGRAWPLTLRRVDAPRGA